VAKELREAAVGEDNCVHKYPVGVGWNEASAIGAVRGSGRSVAELWGHWGKYLTKDAGVEPGEGDKAGSPGKPEAHGRQHHLTEGDDVDGREPAGRVSRTSAAFSMMSAADLLIGCMTCASSNIRLQCVPPPPQKKNDQKRLRRQPPPPATHPYCVRTALFTPMMASDDTP